MTSVAPPPYSSVEDANDVTLVPAKASDAPSSSTQAVTGSNKETLASPNTNTLPNTPLPYSTAPNTPLPVQQGQQQHQQQQQQHQQQQTMPVPTQTAYLPTMNGVPGQVGGGPCMTSPPFTTYGTGTTPMPGVPMYPAAIPMQPMCTQPPAMVMNPAVAGMGPNPVQNGGINLVVNTNANSNSNSNNAGSANGASAQPAPRPCPKCRLGYITRGQARFREMCIKALAYGTICCTCLIPLRLLKTNYVDKCSYCGEEYGFRGELFEKPKPVKI